MPSLLADPRSSLSGQPSYTLGPGFTRQLSLLNPLDYIRLLYWVFFHPQWIVAYVNWLAPGYPDRPRPGKTWQLIKTNVHMRALAVQAFLLLIIFSFTFLYLLQAVGLPIVYIAAVFSTGLGAVVGIVTGAVFGLAYGVVLGVTFGLVGSVWGGVSFGLTYHLLFGMEVGTAFGLAYGVTFGTTLGAALCMVKGGIKSTSFFLMRNAIFGALFAAAFGAVLILARSAEFGLTFGAAFYGWFIICLFRLPLYPFEFFLGFFRGKHRPHPAVKIDGLMILPLPGLRQTLTDTLPLTPGTGGPLFAEYLEYTLQFIPVVRAVNDVLAKNNQDCHAWCRVFLQLKQHDLIQFGTISLHHFRWNTFLRGLLIIPKSLCNRWFPISPRIDTPGRAVCAGYYSLINVFANSPAPAIDEIFAGLDEAIDCFRLAANVNHAYEIINSYTVLRDCLSCKNIDDIAQLAEKSSIPVHEIKKGTGNFAWLETLPEPELRKELLDALRQLRSVTREVEALVNLTSREGRLSAAARANDLLAFLFEFVDQQCFEPEKRLFQFIIDNWTGMITRAGGEVGRSISDIEQIPNNYIIGPALRDQQGRLFVGREDIYNEVLRLWSNEQIKQPVVFWGQRRIGKTSILLHMESNLGNEYLPVFLDMQILAAVKSHDTFLYNLADSIVGQLNKKGLALRVPVLSDYRDEPFIAFRKFIEVTETAVPPGKWLVLMLDEFEYVEEKLNAGVFPSDLMFQFRNIMQHHPRIALVMAGSHHLDELRREYWSPLLNIARVIKVGYLSPEATYKLITNPWENFPLEYDEEAVDRIIISTCGQPLLVQTICSGILERVNERLVQSGTKKSFHVYPGDVDFQVKKTLASCEYFQAVFKALPGQARLFLKALAARQKGPGIWTDIGEVAEQVKDKKIDTAAAVEILKRRDMIEEKDGNIRTSVELVRRWLIK